MPHILFKLKNVNFEAVQKQLKEDAPTHGEQGMVLQYLWENTEKEGELLFLFRVDDMEKTKENIRKTHEEAKRINPEANLPEMVYLEE